MKHTPEIIKIIKKHVQEAKERIPIGGLDKWGYEYHHDGLKRLLEEIEDD